MTGRAHGCRESLAADSNFERFLDGEIVVMILERTILLSPNNLSGCNPIFFHVNALARDDTIEQWKFVIFTFRPATILSDTTIANRTTIRRLKSR